MSSSKTSTRYIKQISSWFTQGGGIIHPAVEIVYNAQYTGYSLRVLPGQHLPAGSQVVSCPHHFALSVLSMYHVENRWPEKFMARWAHAPEVLTRVFLMEQFLLGERSGWRPYIQMLPQSGEGGLDTPLFYGEEDCGWIRGTNLDGARIAREKQWREEFEECVGLLGGFDEERFILLSGKWDLYKWAATILTSRCFSSAAFAMTEGIQQYPTSPNAGYEGLKGPSVPSSCFPILLPVFDIANHNPAANVTWGRENSSCSFITTQDIPAGKEICISYDNKSNEELILGYGFSLFKNPQDAYGLVLKNLSASRNVARVMGMQRALNEEAGGSSREGDALTCTFHLRAADGGDFFTANPALTDIFSLLVANRRELKTVQITPNRCYIPHKANRPLTHSAAKIASTLHVELQRKYNNIARHDAVLPLHPKNNRQFHVARYRRSQLHILKTNIEALRGLLRSANSETTHLVRLEDLLAPSTTSAPNQLRAGIHHVLRTRNAARIREEGYGELVFTLWICGCWVGGQGGGCGTGVDGFVLGEGRWLEWMVDAYGEPGGVRKGEDRGGEGDEGGRVGNEVGRVGYDGGRMGNEEENAETEPDYPRYDGETNEETHVIAESYMDVVRMAAERYPDSVFADEEWSVEMLMWGREVLLEEGLALPRGGGEGEEEDGDDEFVLFVGGSAGE